MFRTFAAGNLVADPTLRLVEFADKETGEIMKANVCNFRLAADEGYGNRKTTTFVSVTVWRKPGEACAKYLKKGNTVAVEGLVRVNAYVGEDKNIHANLEIRADNVEFLSGTKNGVRITATNDDLEDEFL